ncbi:GGDEF domain-containing protein (plasmid) [Streptomyces sp. HU2014]|uniref:GGDEF domain-containing protein n=1 Tax=Streptomyces sp. HU2014 TaxID=2939414 RepID=UPI00200F8E12|nr:GGDEF domain-containing protein [Streptomyces sp. HU2014]UQI49932.1 GGDEF domain-containing protein [Streptomyces sp. HU2014]
MDPVTRVPGPLGQRALLITTLAVPLTGWTLHALTLHRRLAAERRDPLTGAQRRAAFQRRAQRLLARHRQDALLCLVDLDHFKELNDTHGHAAGDAALAATGERLARWAGPHGVVGRLGGDEFAVATRVGEDAIGQHLQALVDALHEPVPTEAGPVAVAASVGAAVPDYLGIHALPALMRGADVSMYRTKHSGHYGWAEIEDLQTPTVNGRRQGRPGTALERAA